MNENSTPVLLAKGYQSGGISYFPPWLIYPIRLLTEKSRQYALDSAEWSTWYKLHPITWEHSSEVGSTVSAYSLPRSLRVRWAALTPPNCDNSATMGSSDALRWEVIMTETANVDSLSTVREALDSMATSRLFNDLTRLSPAANIAMAPNAPTQLPPIVVSESEMLYLADTYAMSIVYYHRAYGHMPLGRLRRVLARYGMKTGAVPEHFCDICMRARTTRPSHSGTLDHPTDRGEIRSRREGPVCRVCYI